MMDKINNKQFLTLFLLLIGILEIFLAGNIGYNLDFFVFKNGIIISVSGIILFSIINRYKILSLIISFALFLYSFYNFLSFKISLRVFDGSSLIKFHSVLATHSYNAICSVISIVLIFILLKKDKRFIKD